MSRADAAAYEHDYYKAGRLLGLVRSHNKNYADLLAIKVTVGKIYITASAEIFSKFIDFVAENLSHENIIIAETKSVTPHLLRDLVYKLGVTEGRKGLGTDIQQVKTN